MVAKILDGFLQSLQTCHPKAVDYVGERSRPSLRLLFQTGPLSEALLEPSSDPRWLGTFATLSLF